MGITSLIFIPFVAIALIGYYLLPKTYQWVWLLLVSFSFYALSTNLLNFIYLLITILSIYSLAKKISNPNTSKNARSLYLFLGLIINFGMLVVLKYGSFIFQQFNQILHFSDQEGLDLLLPLGISFYIFQSTGYLIDVYRKKYKAEDNLFKLALFTTYFPQMIQGPISRFDQLSPQLYEPHSFDWDQTMKGIIRVLWGYVKKMIVADRISIFVTHILTNYVEQDYQGILIFITFFAYGLQLYCDFSGGIDIISGISECFGIHLVKNFNQPYFATSITNFWQRWHISLGDWMKDYVFYPLALSKPFTKLSKFLRSRISPKLAKSIPAIIASFLVFVLVGLWHGAARKFLYYGIYQALFVSSATLLAPIYSWVKKTLHIDSNATSFKAFQIIRTIIITTFGRYITRSSSATEAFQLMKLTFAKWNPWILFDGTLYTMGVDRPKFLLVLIVLVIIWFVDYQKEKDVGLRSFILQKDFVTRWVIYLVLIFSIILFGAYGDSIESTNFIYAGF